MTINGGRTYAVDEVSQFSHSPFVEWADKIIECLSREANDEYELVYNGFTGYDRILRYYAARDRYCQVVHCEIPNSHIPSLCADIRRGFKGFIRLCGHQVNPQSLTIRIYTDIDVQHFFTNPIKLLCMIDFEYYPLSDMTDDEINTPCFVISNTEPNIPLKWTEIYHFQLTDNVGFRGIYNGLFWEHTNTDGLGELIKIYIDIGIFTPLFQKMLEDVRSLGVVDPEGEIFMLDKVNPVVLVDIPKALEFEYNHSGEAIPKPVRLNGKFLPNITEKPNLKYISENSNVLNVKGESIFGMSAGETFISAWLDGKVIKRALVRVYPRMKAKEIRLSQNNAHIAVSETLNLQLESIPTNADNITQISVEYNGDCIKVVKQATGRIISINAIKPGKAIVIVTLEKLKTTCNITVSPKAIQLFIQLSKTNLAIGEIARVVSHADPNNALIGKLEYTVSPSHIARYDARAGTLVAVNRGVAKLIVDDQRNKLKASLNFYVD